ncbi:unnamed protein product [Rotaria sordida]|uniref:Agrin n=1 Tax=Rotaria sordida TaxID=392033 RepID=A0A814BK20_9BILA|nr:unnamed protein product [Rotaria sordida]
MDKSYVVPTGQVYHSKGRRFLWAVLFLIAVIILLAGLLVFTVINRTLKPEIQKKSLTIFDSNFTDSNSNRSERACLYGHIECEFGAICTKQHECRCLFNCTDDDEYIQDETTGKWYLNKCRLDETRCNSYYEKNLQCLSINCSYGSKCLISDNGFPICYCPSNCNEYIRTISFNGSVCGSDHQTYETICELNKRSCEIQENLYIAHLGKCQHCQNSSCILNHKKCDPYINCSFDYQPFCANNFHNYSNECEMFKYACQSNINLIKLHDGTCTLDEQEQLREACKKFICLNGKTCMIENGIGVCRCLFNCSSEKNQTCASNGIIYRNLCEMERDRCMHGENFVPVDSSYCISTCDTTICPYGRCKQQSNNHIECECQPCSNNYSYEDLMCGDNGITYPSKCFLEYDACTRRINIKPSHMGQCNNCQDVVCPFNGQCQSEQGSYSCICPTTYSCPIVPKNNSYTICGSNQELFNSQCEMDIRSCELKTHIYTVAPHYCTKDKDSMEYTQECGYDESLLDLKLDRHIDCDTMDRCPINSYCNKQTNRCCVKVMTAVFPYRMCLSDRHCGRNMICLNGLCQCARNDLMPVKEKRECVSLLPQLSINSSCINSSFGCCKDNITISLTSDRRGCPEYCNCNSIGSLRSSCDPNTDSCYCRPAVSGLSCSYCENEYWGFSRILTHNNTGCTPCGCHPYGSIQKDCLQDTGQCSCHSFTIGRQCDKCIDSSLILTDRGCVSLSKNRYRRQRTCQDLICLFDGICEIINGYPRCTCHHITCTNEEQYLMNICASDGRTYQSKCDIKREQCLKQYEIVLIYPGVCNGNNENFHFEQDNILNHELPIIPIDSKRCITDKDCGENMVCLSEFCECEQQKYKRIPGPQCIMPQSISLRSNNTINPIRRISDGICIRWNPCKNHGICQDQTNQSYTCLCPFGWKGHNCNQKIEITIPYFNQQSYLKLKLSEPIKSIDLTFATEHNDGLILYCDNKLIELYFTISIRKKIIDITIRSDRFISTIQLSDMIDLNTYVRLQIHLLYNEIQVKLNHGNLSSRLLPFDIMLTNILYIGGLPISFHSLSQYFDSNEGFQGCIHELSINGKQILFNNTEHIGQNIDECTGNPCRSVSSKNGIRCIPIRNNDVNSYKHIDNDYSTIDRCLIKPCEINQQCINVHPNNYICICLNCSLNNQYIAGFHSNSYIKHLPFQSLKDTERFKMELWFLPESSSGLLIYSEHINSKKGYFKLYLERKILIFDIIIGSKRISLSSRYPIELNKWHQCLIEIYSQNLSLILDQESPVISYELVSSNILWSRSFTFIGYLPNQYRSTNISIFEGFRGAIQKIILNNHSLNDIRQNAIELYNITEYYGYPCQPNPCTLNRQCHQIELNNYTCIEELKRNDTSLELDGTINAMYAYIPSNLRRNYFDLLLKTKYSWGLIFYIGETSLSFFSNYLSLIVIDGFLQFSVKIDRNSSVALVKSKIRIDDGQWHHIQIERFRRRIIMKLDDNHRYQTILLSKQTEFHPNPSNIYIGGYHRLCSYDEQHCRSYRGCLKNVTIDNNYLDLINDELNRHRILKQCHDFNK